MSFNRRNFIRNSAIAGLGLSLANISLKSYADKKVLREKAPIPKRFRKYNKVRMAFIGVGGMGTAHVSNYIKIPGVEVIAICDIVKDRAKSGRRKCVQMQVYLNRKFTPKEIMIIGDSVNVKI